MTLSIFLIISSTFLLHFSSVYCGFAPKPNNVIVQEISFSSIRVRWSPPDLLSDSWAKLNYTVSLIKEDGIAIGIRTVSNKHEIEFHKLPPCSRLYATVASVSSAGVSEYVYSHEFVTRAVEKLSLAMPIVKVIHKSHEISWPNASISSCPQNCSVRQINCNSSIELILECDDYSSSVTITSLPPNRWFRYQVSLYGFWSSPTQCFPTGAADVNKIKKKKNKGCLAMKQTLAIHWQIILIILASVSSCRFIL